MRIAVFGFYNHINAGDDRIQYCLTRILRDKINSTLVFFPHYEPPPIEYLKSFDWVIIGGGGLVSKHMGIWRDIKRWISKIRSDIGIVGLGINNMSGLENEIKALLDKAKFFCVRDEQSKKYLKDDPRVLIYPDLSWCYPFHAIDKTAKNNNIIAVNFTYAPWSNLDPKKWLDKLPNMPCIPLPLYFSETRDLGAMRDRFGASIPEEFSITTLEKASLLLGCRYHAITFSMQLRRPFIAICYDNKVRELVREARLLDYLLNTDECDRLQEKIDLVACNRDTIIQTIDKYASTQEKKATELISFIRRKVYGTT